MYSHVHAGLWPDCGRHGLDSGSSHHPSGKFDCLDSHAAECACRHSLWHPVSCFCARVIRCARSECSCDSASAGGMRLVRHPGVDWRPSDLLHVANLVAWRCKFPRQQLDLLFSFLGNQHARHLARDRNDQIPGRRRRAVHAGRGIGPSFLDHTQSGWIRSGTAYAE